MRGARVCVVAGLAVLLTSCAQPPVTKFSVPIVAEQPFARALEARRRVAIDDETVGDWADAVAQWQIIAILDPGDRAVAERLATARKSQREAALQAYRAATSASNNGDIDEALRQFVRTLAIDPQHAGAAKALRDLDSRRMTRVQADRAARVRRDDEGTTPVANPHTVQDAQIFDLEQSIALFSAGNTEHGLRDMRRYAAEKPSDQAGRRRMAEAVADRARRTEETGAREGALNLYLQAGSLATETPNPWATKITALRRSLVAEYNAKAQHDSLNDLAAAIRSWETALRIDPGNIEITLQLQRARQIQAKLKRIEN